MLLKIPFMLVKNPEPILNIPFIRPRDKPSLLGKNPR